MAENKRPNALWNRPNRTCPSFSAVSRAEVDETENRCSLCQLSRSFPCNESKSTTMRGFAVPLMASSVHSDGWSTPCRRYHVEHKVWRSFDFPHHHASLALKHTQALRMRHRRSRQENGVPNHATLDLCVGGVLILFNHC